MSKFLITDKYLTGIRIRQEFEGEIRLRCVVQYVNCHDTRVHFAKAAEILSTDMGRAEPQESVE